ncbi:enoyl-CoA hydratase-related protein [Alcaligenes endophyticus]|uniref:Enoyl-CoA hydratase-related protein n=1 Tax=Alcaligenes endophyticus TaxID=1929088 RepID=A0ABT8EIR5_9BURK|nr:enoyl-CoA hydratase-related protein [Alcaligenes endophyticus]MCX5592446.1 enoyl-CoA hydratase-related protein [Alcaligenes endophyticus]MDN4121171.1 enoyl-CoA hydratase-related protein [Alcaligenes endophyticus]
MIKKHYEHGLLTLTFARPERRNAINLAMYEQLSNAIDHAPEDCHSILLTGSGGHFTAGNDIHDFAHFRQPQANNPALDFLRSLVNTDIPVIAAVQGHAVGIGVTLLLHCDFVYADSDTVFSLPFVSLGLCPEGGTTILLEALVGRRRASAWLLQGQSFTAQEALEAQLLNAVSANGTSLDEALACSARLAAQPLQALRLSKRMLREPGRPALLRAIEQEVAFFIERLESPEATQALARFL